MISKLIEKSAIKGKFDGFIYCILEKNIKFILILFKIFNLHLYHNNKRYKLNLN